MNVFNICRAESPLGPLLIGFASGSLTAIIVSAYLPIAMFPFIAVPFGLATVALVYLRRGECSGWKVAALLPLSMAAYWIALYGTGYLLDKFPQIPNGSTYTGSLVVFSMAGFIGAFAITLAIVAMFSGNNTGRMLVRSVLCSLWGGLSGLVAAAIPMAIGIAMRRMGRAMEGTIWDKIFNPFGLAFLFWQTAMALVIFRIVPEASVMETGEGRSLSRSRKIHIEDL